MPSSFSADLNKRSLLFVLATEFYVYRRIFGQFFWSIVQFFNFFLILSKNILIAGSKIFIYVYRRTSRARNQFKKNSIHFWLWGNQSGCCYQDWFLHDLRWVEKMQVKSLYHRIDLACEVKTASTVQRKMLGEFVEDNLVNGFFSTFRRKKWKIFSEIIEQERLGWCR